MKFRAAVLHEVGADLAIETVESGPLAPGDVLVKIRAASICHTDLEVITGDLRYPLPLVLGHEAAGTVAEVGADVRHLGELERGLDHSKRPDGLQPRPRAEVVEVPEDRARLRGPRDAAVVERRTSSRVGRC